VTIFALAGFLATVAATAIVVGVHDVSLNEVSLGLTAGSAVLLAVGALLLIAVYHLVLLGRSGSWEGGARPLCKLSVPVAFFVTTLLGVYLLFAGLGTSSAQRPLVVAFALLLIVVALLGIRFFAHSAHVTLPRVGAAVALGVIGTTIGAWEFWYQNQYVPSRAGQAVTLSVGLHRVGVQGAYDVIRATVGYEDVGGKSVSVLGSVYTLTGSRVVHCSQTATAKRVGGLLGFFLTDPQRIRYMSDVYEERPAAVLAAGKFVGDGKRLDSNVSSGRDFVFFVPHGRYQLLRIRAQLFAIPGSVRLSQRTLPQYTRYKGDSELYVLWHIDDDSWFDDLVFGRERWVVVRYEIVDPGNEAASAASPDMRVTARFPDPTWSQGTPSEASVKHLFIDSLGNQSTAPSDASEPFADTEMTLQPATEPDTADKHRLPVCGT